MQHKYLSGQDSHSPSQEQIENQTGSILPGIRCVTYSEMGTLYPTASIAEPGDDVRGITTGDIQNGTNGFVMVYGIMYNLNTIAWPSGTSLYCDNNGVLTDVSNGFPQVANVLRSHASLGVLQITCLDTPAAMSVAVQDTDSIELDSVGSSVSADLKLSANAASANNLKATTTIKSGASKGLHVEYPFAKADTDGVLKKQDWSTFNNKVNANDARLSVQNRLQVKKNPGTGEFASIADAIGSILDSSESNPYLVQVGPGIYEEPELIVPSNVSIEGASITTTIVSPIVGAQNLFVMSQGTELSYMSFIGHPDSVGSGFSAVKCEDVGDFAQFHKISVYDFDIGFQITSVTADSVAYLEYVDINGDYSYAVHNSASNGFISRCQAENFYTYDSNSTIKTSVLCEGAGSEILLHTAGLLGSGTGAKGLVIRNGTIADISAAFFHDFDTAIEAQNTGAACNIEVSGSSFKNCTKDIKILHAGTTGFFQGYADASKLQIDTNAPFFITGKDAQIITVAKEGGDYVSIKAALDAITDNSATKPYVVQVGPGIFIEDTLMSKTFVTLKGSGTGVTIIQVNDVNKNVIEANVGFTVRDVTLQGATGTGKSAIYVRPTTAGRGVLVKNVEFRNNYTFIKLLVDSTNIGIVDTTNLSMPSSVNVVKAFDCESTTGTQALFSVDGLKALILTTIPTVFNITGAGAFFVLTNVALQSAVGGNFIKLANGSRLVGQLLSLEGFNTSIEVQNVGSPSSIQIISSILISTTNDLLISHPGTVGSFQGQADNAKITIDPASIMRMNYVDAVDPVIGTVTLGELLQGDRHDRLLSISKLARQTSPVGTYAGGVITKTTGLGISVSAGGGFAIDTVGFMKDLMWNTTALTLPANASSFIYINNSGVVTSSTSEPNVLENLILGQVTTYGSSVYFIDKSSYRNNQLPTRIEQYQRDAIGSIFSAGCIVTQNGTRQLNVSAGSYYFGNTKFSPSAGTIITWDAQYQNGSGGFSVLTQTTVSNSQYDNGSGTLASLTAGYYAKHSLYVSGDGADQKYHLVYAQAQYSTLVQAESANIPTPPTSFTDAVVLIATIIVQQGVSLITQIRDERPIIGFKASGISASATHGNLLGLGADDHLQYLPVNGSRGMSGPLSLNNNPISDVTTVNGVVVENHATRHLPNGSDPITTAAPSVNLNATGTNGVGTANSMARSDHRHGIDTGVASTQAPDQTNATGVSANLARADHVHNIPTAVAIGMNANSTNTQGAASTFSKSDHTHAIASGLASTQTPDQINAAGTSTNFARADHIHNVPTAAPVTVDANGTNGQGVASTFSKSDHKHNVATAVPSAQIPDQGNAEGSSSGLARADHIHNIPAAAPIAGLSPATSNTKGTAQTFSLSDHSHAVATGTVGDISVIQPDDVAVAGIANRYSRADHKHAIVTDAPVTTLSPAIGNTEGSGTSFARNDHTHAIATGIVGDISTILPDAAASAGAADRYSRADHVHAITAAPASSINTSSTNTEGASPSFARADHTHAVAVTAIEVSSNVAATITSTTDVLMTTMTTTPASGIYLVVFSCWVLSSSGGAEVITSIYSGGTLKADSERQATPRAATTGVANDAACISTNGLVTVNGSQAIEIRWRTTAGTATVTGRTMNLIKVG